MTTSVLTTPRRLSPRSLEHVAAHLSAPGSDLRFERRRGRNPSFVVTAPSGESVFVKQFPGPGPALQGEVLAREIAPGLVPPILSRSEGDPPCLLLPDLADRPSLATLAADDDGRLTRAMSALGHALADLHATAPLLDRPASDVLGHALSHAAPLEAAQYVAASGATLQAVRVLQERSSALGDVAARLAGAPTSTTTVHGELRLDQALVGADGAVAVLDWETAGTGAPELDLGFVVGDLFATLLLAAADGGKSSGRPRLRDALAGMPESFGPPRDALFSSYLARTPARPSPPRVAATAAVFLVDRVLAAAQQRAALREWDRMLLEMGLRLAQDEATALRLLIGEPPRD